MKEELIARYPFLEEGKKLVGTEKVSFEEIERAADHVLETINQAKPGPKPRGGNAAQRVRQLALAKAVLACLGSYDATKKFASNKAREAAAWLAEDETERGAAMKSFFPSYDGESVSVPDYLRYGTSLANQEIAGGRAYVNESSLAQMLRQAIEAKLSDLSGINPDKVPEEIKEAADDLYQKLPRTETRRHKGKYLELNCIKEIARGVSEGRRYYGAMTLAIACLKDGLPKDEAQKIIGEYVGNCRKTSHEYTAREAHTVLDWVYAHPTIGFSCKTAQAQGFGPCEGCAMRKK